VSGREWRITLPAGTKLPNANRHRNPMQLYRLGQQLQSDVRWYARAARIPHGLAKVQVTCYVVIAGKRRLDPANYAPAAKAVVDGLVAEGIIPDDDWKHVTGPDMRVMPGTGHSGFIVHITELEE
jgi:hypothetical protein